MMSLRGFRKLTIEAGYSYRNANVRETKKVIVRSLSIPKPLNLDVCQLVVGRMRSR